jgi:hypothetical protein
MRIIASELFAVGNCIVKVVVDVFDPPKSKTHTVGLIPPDL